MSLILQSEEEKLVAQPIAICDPIVGAEHSYIESGSKYYCFL